jgi:hypothetical protein
MMSCGLSHSQNLGYTVELVPLLVKISAINRLIQAAKGHRRAVLRRDQLFRTVSIIGLFVVIFLVLWTVLDPPTRHQSYSLSRTISGTGDVGAVLEITSYCASDGVFWRFIAIGWNFVLLLSGSVLAFQSRKIKMRDFNESLTVGLIVYSQTIFVCLRVVIWTVLKDSVGESALAHCESIIFSTDTVVTCSIYFFPKFKRRKDEKSRSSHFGFLTPSIVEKVKSGPFSSSNDNFGLSTGDSDIDPSDTFDAMGPRFDYGSGNRNGSSDENNKNKNKNKLPTISENHHQSRSKQIPPCPQCGYTYYLSIPSGSYDDEDDGESTSVAAAPLVSPQMDDVLTLSEEKKSGVTTDSDYHYQSQARSETTLSSSSTTGGDREESPVALDPHDSMFDSCTVDNDPSVIVDA